VGVHSGKDGCERGGLGRKAVMNKENERKRAIRAMAESSIPSLCRLPSAAAAE
jgi:hypothetical protein